MTETTNTEIDGAKAEAFAGQMMNMLNQSMLSLMTSVGHQTGLFDTMAKMPASTSMEIATEGNLNERYVREWLGSMVTGHIVTYDPEKKTYSLPAEHAAFLTTAAGEDNVAILTQFLPMMGNVEPGIIESFRNGGGVPYSEYATFHRLMAETSAAVHDNKLIGTILPLVDGLVGRLEEGIDVADVGCGSGHAINLMARTYPDSRFTGYDFSEEGIGRGTSEASRLGLSNAHFEVLDAAKLNKPGAFDLITVFDAIHDQAKPAVVLKNIFDAVRDKGTFLMVDVAASSEVGNNTEHPLGPFLYGISTMHCMTVSLALDGDGLGAVWGEELARSMLKDAGFHRINIKQIEGDVFNNYYITTKG